MKAIPQPGVLFHFLLTDQERTSWCQRLLCAGLALSLPSSDGKPDVFSGKPLDGEEVFERKGRKDCNRSTKTTETQQLAGFSSMTGRQTAIEG